MGQQTFSSLSSSEWTYDVFLSFRGEDCRYGFAGNLYNALQQKGIHTFMDDEELKRGDEISPALLKAIKQSRVAIIIFSENYASSTWCLEELVEILSCTKSGGHLVYPIFYKVDPSEVRHQRGSYGAELAKHEEKLKNNKDKVQKWRSALYEAAHLAGWQFRDGYEYEYKFIERIIGMVSSKSISYRLHVADYPVGLKSRALEVISLLNISGSSVNMLGVCGIGGIGKTTLARAIYNLIGDQFEGLCFLADVRENSIKHGLVHLQETILSDILGEKIIKLGDVHKGVPILAKKLHRMKVLLVLDDVDELEHLRKLAGGCNWFGSGSKIVITTRDRHILAAHGVEKVYDLPKLSYDESLELLRKRASKRIKPDACYMEVWNRAVLYAGGLPLALNVIGSDLLGKTTDEWKSALDRYEKLPNEEIQNILKVSFNSLNQYEKQSFLDIACFFIGELLAYVEEILHASGFFPKYSIRALIDKSLISISEDKRVVMHDLIKDMGREIVRQESPSHPGKRSRLWLYEDVLQVLTENMGSDKIEVIMLDNIAQGKEIIQWSGKAFKKMKILRILVIKNACCCRGPSYLPNSLTVLDWRGYPSGSFPPDFRPTKLAILNLPSSCLSFFKPFKNLERLTSMDFTDGEFLTEVPDLSGLPNLRTLYLDNCKNLTKVHDSVGFLGHLEEFSAAGCTNLSTIPSAINLTSLRFLSLSECLKLVRFPEILGNMENIRHINLWQTAIKELPFSIGNLVGLESLILSECSSLIQVSSSIFTLPRLHGIEADSCRGLEFFNEGKGNEQLKSTLSPSRIHLNLSSCNLSDEHLAICLSGFVNVVCLDLSYNDFTILPACIEECIHLRTLWLQNCKQLRDISGIPPKLEVIDALNCTSLTAESSGTLLSKAFHTTGDKNVMLPSSRIPEWFDHWSWGRSVTFWSRRRFPQIAVCTVFGILGKPPHYFRVNFRIQINGQRELLTKFCYSWSIVKDHVWLFDLRALVWDGSLQGLFQNQDWNHVEISCEDCPMEHSIVEAENGPTRKANVKWFAFHVYREESRMEDILFPNTNPIQDKNYSYLTAQSRDVGAIHDSYYKENDDDLDLSC